MGEINYQVELVDSNGNPIGISGNPLIFGGGSGIGIVSDGTYNSTAPVLTNGQTASLQLDSSGDLYVNLASLLYGEDATNNVLGVVLKPIIGTTYSRSPFNTTGSATVNIKNAAGQLFSVFGYNEGASLAFIQIHNTATTPSSGATPLFWAPLPAGSATVPGTVILDGAFFGDNGIYGSSGLAIAFSSTATTYTAVGTPANFGGGGTYY